VDTEGTFFISSLMYLQMKKKNKLQIFLLRNKISNSWILLEGKVI